MTFHFMCVHIIFSSVFVAEWSPFGKYLLTRLTICSLCILTICNISNFPFFVLRAGFGFRLALIFAYFSPLSSPYTYHHIEAHHSNMQINYS